jgi:hypothetical protein
VTINQLKSQRRWLLHTNKVPKQPNGSNARPNDPGTWNDYVTCAAVASQFSGLGVALGDGVVGFDLDDVLVDGNLVPETQEIVTMLDSYTEITPSGDGLHTLVCGILPGPGVRKRLGTGPFVEIKSTGFYFTWTAAHLEGAPLDLMERQAEIEALYQRFRPPVTAVSDGVARPEAVQKFVRRFTAYAERLGATITAVKTVAGKTLILTSPCLLHDDHDGGVGITADGIRCVQCFHNRCAVGWARWSRAVEQKFGQPMLLDGVIQWKK